jgi:hypothetical protein
LHSLKALLCLGISWVYHPEPGRAFKNIVRLEKKFVGNSIGHKMPVKNAGEYPGLMIVLNIVGFPILAC